MNIRLMIGLLFLATALGAKDCKKSKIDVSHLKELPTDIAVNLKRITDSDVWISIAPLPATNPGGTTLVPSCSERQTYCVQVIYPVTVCARPELAPNAMFVLAPPRHSGP